MTAVVCVDMLPASSHIGGIVTMCTGAAAGGVFMALLSPLIHHSKNSSIAYVGYMVLVGIALHNLPEGLAVGSSLAQSTQFALALALLMLLHNIPEGLAVCLPLRLSGMSVPKMLLLSLLTGLPTAAGALIGTAVGRISDDMIGRVSGFCRRRNDVYFSQRAYPGIGHKKSNVSCAAGRGRGYYIGGAG